MLKRSKKQRRRKKRLYISKLERGYVVMELNGFFDKVKKSSADAMDKAKDTTKRLMTVNDLKSKIRGYNNDKEKLFTQIGMDLYIAKKQGENIDEAIDAFVSQIDTLNIRVKNLQEKLDLLESGDSVDVEETKEREVIR